MKMYNWPSILASTPALAIVLSGNIREILKVGLEAIGPLMAFYIMLSSLILTPLAYIAKVIYDIKISR